MTRSESLIIEEAREADKAVIRLIVVIERYLDAPLMDPDRDELFKLARGYAMQAKGHISTIRALIERERK